MAAQLDVLLKFAAQTGELTRATREMEQLKAASTGAGGASLLSYPVARQLPGLMGNVATQTRSVASAARSIPNLVSLLNTGAAMVGLDGVLSRVQSVGAAIRGLGMAGSVSALGIGVGLAPVAYLGYLMNQRRQVDRDRTESLGGNNRESIGRLQRIINQRAESGELRGSGLEDLRANLQSLLARQGNAERAPAGVREELGRNIQAEIRRVTQRLAEESGATWQTTEDGARLHAQTLLEIANQQRAQELSQLTLHLNQVLADRKASEEQQTQALELYIQRRRGMLAEARQDELEQMATEERLLNAQRERAEGDRGRQAEIDLQLEALRARRKVLAEQEVTDLEQMEVEKGQRLEEIRQRFEERRLNQQLQAAERESRDAQRQIQMLSDMQAAADVRTQRERARLDGDLTLTAIERRRQRLEGMRRETEEIDRQVGAFQRLADAARESLDAARQANASPEMLSLLEQRTAAADNALRDAQRRQAQSEIDYLVADGPDPESWRDQWSVAITSIQDQWGSWAQQSAMAFQASFNGAIGTVSGALTSVIMQTQGWYDNLRRIPLMIGTQIVGSIVQMGVRWVATQLMMAVVGKSIQASVTAANAPLAAAQAAMWATPATLATISSYGGAAAAAPGAIAGAQAAVLAQSLLAFAEGGLTPGQATLAVVGERGPELILPADVTARLSAGQREALVAGDFASAGAGPGSGGGSVNMRFAGIFDGRRAALDALRTEEGEALLIDFYNRQAWRVRG